MQPPPTLLPVHHRRLPAVARSVCLWAAWALALAGVSPATGAGIRLLGATATGVRLEFTAPDAQQPGQAARSCLVGVPLGATVRLETLSAHPGQRVPAPAQTAPGGWSTGPVALGEAGFLRQQRVVEVQFAPQVQADGTWQLFDSVVAEVFFDPPQDTSAGRAAADGFAADSAGEEVLRDLVVNYDQARAWRRVRPGAPRAKRLQDGASAWVRLYTQDEGLYRVTGAELQAAGVNLATLDPQRLHLRYGGGRPLVAEEAAGPLALAEMALEVNLGADGRFGANDTLVFYAEPASRWVYDVALRTYRWLRNPYTDENVYWLELHGDLRADATLSRRVAPDAVARAEVTDYRARVHQEEEQYILVQTYQIKSGYDWYWEDFTGNARNLPVVISHATADPVTIRVGFFGVADSQPRFQVRWNDQSVGDVTVPKLRQPVVSVQTVAGPREGTNHVGLFEQNSDPVRLDYLELEYGRQLNAEHGELYFDYSPAGPTRFRLSGFSGGRPHLFEVSTGAVRLVDATYDSAAGTVLLQDDSGSRPRRYAAGTSSSLRRVARLVLDDPGHLAADADGGDYLIITHASFRPAAEYLAAWRGVDDRFGAPLHPVVVDVQDIYDEFSGGLLDPAAIRRFIEFAEAHWQRPPVYVLLFGDGTYDYKNNSGTSPGNWIPAYQDGDSTYDEWYCSGGDAVPDLAIGRIPAQTEAEAEAVVAKILSYDQDPEVGLWQSRMLLIADDLVNLDDAAAYETYFLLDAEYLARYLLPPNLNLTKLYLGQYLLEGRTKPRARADFLRRFNEGNLLVTYVGHGNPDVLAHERMFVVSRDQGEIANGHRWPFFYTAASQVGVFDDPVRASMPEVLLRMPDAGVIGMVSASRVGYHDSNMMLANAFHQRMYRTDRSHVPVGLALMEAKQEVQVSTLGDLERRNIRRYTLFGDPAQRLAMPRRSVALTVPDTLHALGEVQVQGQVLGVDGGPDAGFNGEVWVQAFDSAVPTRLDGLPFQQVGAPLFRGRYAVHAGAFEARFRVPKDITYQGSDSRVSAYAWAPGTSTALGYVGSRVLAGTAAGVVSDNDGPEIDLGFEGLASFASGGRVPAPAVLRAVLRDASGVNVTGETGHEIEVDVDGTASRVTEYYAVIGGDYREGVLTWPLPALEPGTHEIRLKAWDSQNNSARVTAQFELTDTEPGPLGRVLFYPNPATSGSGSFTYSLAAAVRRVRLRVFAISGRQVDELAGPVTAGFNQVGWPGAAFVANGVYLARIEAEDTDGHTWTRTAAVQVAR